MNTEPLVLAVDDEDGILRLMKLELTAQHFRVLTTTRAEETLRLVEELRPDVVLLDVVMPDVTGLELMRRLHEHGSTPIILVTANDRIGDKVRGLEMGAADYIVKPFGLDELGARIRAVLRRSTGQEAEHVLRSANIQIDLTRRLVKRDGVVVSLTRTEWLLLQHLAHNAGKVILSAELLTAVWGPDYRDDVEYLRVWVSRLRHKLEPEPGNPVIIKTLLGIGYVLHVDSA